MNKLKPNKWFGYILIYTTILTYFFRNMKRNDDIWFLLSHGRYVLNKGFPHTEFLSMHKNLHFIMQQWLSSVIYYITFKIGGSLGLYILLFIMLLIYIYLIYKLCMIISDNKIYVSCFITSIISLQYATDLLVNRPQVFSYLVLIGELIILELYIKNKKDLLFLLPILSILLINLHAAMWPVLFILILPFIAELIIDLIKKKNNKIYKLLIIFIISIFVGFINPYGIENMTYSLKSMNNNTIQLIVEEMRSVNLNLGSITAVYGIILILSLMIMNLLMINQKNNKTKTHEILLIYGTFLMALINMRNYGIFLISAIPFMTKYINIKDGKTNYFPKLLYIIITIILIIGIINNINTKNYVLHNPNEKIVKYLNKKKDYNIKIYTANHNDGSFLEYYGYKTYSDSRVEIYTKKINKKEDILDEDYYFRNNYNNNFKKLDNKYKFDYYVVQKKKKSLIKVLEKNNFKLVYKTKYRYLYKRNN